MKFSNNTVTSVKYTQDKVFNDIMDILEELNWKNIISAPKNRTFLVKDKSNKVHSIMLGSVGNTKGWISFNQKNTY